MTSPFHHQFGKMARVMLSRVGTQMSFKRPDGGDLRVPDGEVWEVPAGTTVYFDNVYVDGTLYENGTLIEDSEENIEDKYGKRDDTATSYVSMGEYLALKMYTGDDTELPDNDYVTGGRQPTEEPYLVTPHDVPLQVNDRVTTGHGKTYAIDTVHDRHSYLMCKLTPVTSNE